MTIREFITNLLEKQDSAFVRAFLSFVLGNEKPEIFSRNIIDQEINGEKMSVIYEQCRQLAFVIAECYQTRYRKEETRDKECPDWYKEATRIMGLIREKMLENCTELTIDKLTETVFGSDMHICLSPNMAKLLQNAMW